MASKRDRQRKLERARIERRIARRAQRVRRKRQIQAGVGAALAVVVIVVGLAWLMGGFEPQPPEEPAVASGTCTWNLKDPASNSGITDTGHPETTGEAREGTETMTIDTNLGEIQATIDLATTPCTAASLRFLGEKNFYTDSRCHYLDTNATYLQCGDKTGNGSGAPSYTFDRENVPAGSTSPSPSASADPGASASPAGPYYAKGTVLMANTDANTNAGQFLIVYGDGSDLGPEYSIVGMVTKGLSIVEGIANAGARTSDGQDSPAGNPKTDLIIQRLYLGAPPDEASPSPATSPTATAEGGQL